MEPVKFPKKPLARKTTAVPVHARVRQYLGIELPCNDIPHMDRGRSLTSKLTPVRQVKGRPAEYGLYTEAGINDCIVGLSTVRLLKTIHDGIN